MQDAGLGPNDTYVNVWRSPNGELVKAMGNGTTFMTNGRADTMLLGLEMIKGVRVIFSTVMAEL